MNKINKIDPTDISGDKTVGKTINKIQENNERNIKTILNLIDSDIYTKENSSNTFNNYFENAGVPCYKNVPFTNMVIPLPIPRYNYIISNPKSDSHIQNILQNTDLSKKSKQFFYYEKMYQLYNEPIYFSNNGKNKTGMGKPEHRQTIPFNLSKCWRRYDLKGPLNALINTTTHKWNVRVTRRVFTENDVRDGKRFSILFWKNDDGTKKILCNLDQVIFELNPIRNELYKNQGTIYGGGHETINENNRNLKAKKKVRYFNYEGREAREVYRNLRITHVNDSEIKFENGDVFSNTIREYSEWRDKPLKVILEYVDFSRPLFNKCTNASINDENWEELKGHVGERVKVNADKTIQYPIGDIPYNPTIDGSTPPNPSTYPHQDHNATKKIYVKWGNYVSPGDDKLISSAECNEDGIIRLNDGSWFYNPAYIEARIEFDNVRTENKYTFNSNENINNLFDKRQTSCKFINLPTKGGVCRRRPILTADYWNIKNNYPELTEQCPWVKSEVESKTREGFNNIDKFLSKKNIANVYLGASGLLFLYLLFKLKQKSKY